MSEFLPYKWMREINRSDLPKRCRDVLRMLAAELRPGTREVQMGVRDMLDRMGMCDHNSLREALIESEKLGWISVDKSLRPYLYRAEDVVDTNTSTDNDVVDTNTSDVLDTTTSDSSDVGNQHNNVVDTNTCGKPTRVGNQHVDVVDTNTSMCGKPTRLPITEKKQRALEASSSSAHELSNSLAFFRKAFESAGHDVTDHELLNLIDHLESYQDSAVGYLQHRIEADAVVTRIRSTRVLLKSLATDAINDGRINFGPEEPTTTVVSAPPSAANYQARTPTLEPPTLSAPEVWQEALNRLGEQVSQDAWNSYIAPLEAEVQPNGITLWARDDFHQAWVQDHFADLIEAACPGPITFKARRTL